jgi:hypothetical protein
MTANGRDAPTAASLDVLQIDEYFLHLLRPRFQSIFKQFDMHVPNTSAKAILHSFIIWMMLSDTPASRALGLKVENNSRRRVLSYTVFAAVLPVLYQHLVEWYDQSLLQQDTYTMSSLDIRALDRKRHLARKIISSLKTTIPVMQLAVLMSWWAAKAPASTISMLAAGISFAPTANPRNLNVSYAHRRWTYESIFRSIQLTTPVHSFQDIKVVANYMLSPVLAVLTRVTRQRDEGRCEICNSQPMVVPYVTNCGHMYCYTCLWIAMAQSSSFCCRRCAAHVTESRRSKVRDILQ